MTLTISSRPMPWESEKRCARIRVEHLVDPLIDSIGHDPRSLYVERFWLPILGPSTTFLLRRCAAELERSPAGVDLEIEELARRIGIGERNGPNAPFARTLKRCVDFNMASWRGDVFAVRRRLPPLAQRHLRRLPASLREEHDREPASRSSETPRRLCLLGSRLAASLLQYGSDQAATEAELVRFGIAAPLARRCVAQAHRVLASGRAGAGSGPVLRPSDAASPAVARDEDCSES